MQTKEYSVYNETRENFLSSRVTFIDTKSDPLRAVKVLIEGLAPNAETGLWLNPLRNIPTVPRLSSYDLVYLDKECRVVQGMALVADDDAPPFDGHATSALVLPIHSFSASHSHPGDKVILCATEHLDCPPVPPASDPTAVAQPASAAPKQSAAPAVSPVVLCKAIPLAATPLLQTERPALHSSEPNLPFSKPDLRCTEPPAALPPSALTDAPSSQVPDKDWVHFRFLRSIVRLRVQISISVSPVAAFANALPASTTNVLPAALEPEVSAPAPKRPILSTLTASLARSTRAVAQKCRACSVRYMRWADAFFFRPVNNPGPLFQRWIPSLGKLFLSAIFPR
ncbi:MAG: hypothetical protein WBV28_15165 [Terracidiphilus sp.]